MFINSRFLRLKTLRAFFSTQQAATSFSFTSTPLQTVQRLANDEYNFLKFQSIFKQCEIEHTIGATIHRDLPLNQKKKLNAIQSYIDTLTEEEIKYLKYLLADEVGRKRHNKLYPDNKRDYYYELGFFGRQRLDAIQKIEISGKQQSSQAIK